MSASAMRAQHVVAICTARGMPALGATLPKVLSVLGKGSFILVIANGPACDDHAIAGFVSRQCVLHGVEGAVLQERRRGIGYARNAVLDFVDHGLVSFLDDDTAPRSRAWQKAILSGFEARNVGMITGPIFVAPPEGVPATPWWRTPFSEGFLGRSDLGAGGECDAKWVFGGNASYRRSAIGDSRFRIDLGPGGGVLFGEDTEFSMRMAAQGQIAWYDLDVAVDHYVDNERWHASAILWRAYELGRFDRMVAERGRSDGSSVRWVGHVGKLVCRCLGRMVTGRLGLAFEEACRVAWSLGFGGSCQVE